MFPPSIRISFFIIAFACFAATVAALIMQYGFDMEPCPLCISQRIFVILVGITALLGGIFGLSRLGSRLASLFGIVFAFIGGSISARHVWIQNLPEDQVPLCGPGLAYMFETRPFFDALGLLFKGDGHCADVSFSFLGLTIPGWTLVFFIANASALIWIAVRNFLPSNK